MLQHAITWLQGDNILATTVRTLFVYAFALAAVRLGSKRFLSQASAFDVIVAIMLGSILSRAVRPEADLGPTLLSAALLVAVHWVLAALTARLDWFGPLVKGRPKATLERNGSISVIPAERKPAVLDIQVEHGVQTVRITLE